MKIYKLLSFTEQAHRAFSGSLMPDDLNEYRQMLDHFPLIAVYIGRHNTEQTEQIVYENLTHTEWALSWFNYELLHDYTHPLFNE